MENYLGALTDLFPEVEIVNNVYSVVQINVQACMLI